MRLADLTTQVRDRFLLAKRHAAPFKQIARVAHPGFADDRPWPFLQLYHGWFQSTPPPRPTALPGLALDYVSEELWQPEVPERAAPPTADELARLPLYLKGGTPYVIVGDNRHSGVVCYNPSFYPRPLIREIVGQYEMVVSALVQDPDQTVTRLRRRAGTGGLAPAHR
jgi:hypothetical protein